MKIKTKWIVVIIVVITLAVAAYMFRDKIKALFSKKDEAKNASADTPDNGYTAPADTTAATTTATSSYTPSASSGSSAMGTAGTNVTYSNAARTITVDGTTYSFSSKEDVRKMQNNLLNALSNLAAGTPSISTGNPFAVLNALISNGSVSDTATRAIYRTLYNNMMNAGGADGIIGKRTAEAFAVAARKLPNIVSQYKK